VTELRQLEAQQIQHRTHLAVQRQLFQHREMERTQIARDLHDGPLQDLIATSFGLVEAMSTDEKEDRLRKMRKIQESMQRNIRDLRVFCNDLRPPVLAPFGLEKTIQSHMESFRMRFPDIKIYLTLMPDGKRIPESIRMTMFRIFQEVMNNIVKHAHATELRISLFLDPNQVVLEVKDNGVGFHVPTDWVEVAQQGHLGLIGMRERIESIGGTLEINATPGRGTRIEVTAPLAGVEMEGK
jgi:signal transduction histidine kinase